MALFDAMVGHVFAKDTEAATLDAWLEEFAAFFEVFNGLSVLVNRLASWVGAFELETVKILRDISMDGSEVNIFVSLTLFGAVTVVLSPWIDAIIAEESLATAALERALDDICADGANEIVGFLSELFVGLNQVSDIQALLGFRWFGVWCRIVGKAVWIFSDQLFDFFLGYFDRFFGNRLNDLHDLWLLDLVVFFLSADDLIELLWDHGSDFVILINFDFFILDHRLLLNLMYWLRDFTSLFLNISSHGGLDLFLGLSTLDSSSDDGIGDILGGFANHGLLSNS